MFKNFRKSYIDFFRNTIEEYGGGTIEKPKYVFRNNTDLHGDFPDKAFFGCVNEGEASKGRYRDLSIVVFPSNENADEDDRWIIALGVGSDGYEHDNDLVLLPGTRRLFVNNLNKDSFIKNDFTDIGSTDGFKSFCKKNNVVDSLKKGVKGYENLLIACTYFDPNKEDESKEIISKYLAIYAQIRDWPTNNSHRNNIIETLKKKNEIKEEGEKKEEDEIKELLKKRKYIVLQGAPGTGKTRMAKKIVEGCNNVFFTQFHAETTYSDFIYGILPDVKNESLKYIENKGVFVKAIETAKSIEEAKAKEESEEANKKEQNVYLIIDEINRANLSNVLGPAFYLFEPTMEDSKIKIEICPGLTLDRLPDNLYVIATMNTADRSLAVVDFALRRRFAWYTMYPHVITADDGKTFCDQEFMDIANIFEKYATDEELNLQPGQAYFVVPKHEGEKETEKKEMNFRLKYEVMPLIREYLNNGMLARAKDDFINYFRNEIQEEMYR